MSRVTEIRQTVKDYRVSAVTTGVLQDISAVKMQNLRKQFTKNADFFNGIRSVYELVKAQAKISGLLISNGAHEDRGRDIYIGLTSNKRFYGTLNRDISRSLSNLVQARKGSDFLIVGQTGSEYLRDEIVRGEIKSIKFNDDVPDAEEMKVALSLADTHARVFVVYPRLINIFRQEVVMTDITQTPDDSAEQQKTIIEYIFEPEIPDMLAFFERQVRHALMERVMLETELARAAARTMKMRNAKDRANSLEKSFERALKHELAMLADIGRMDSFIRYTFWKA